SCAVRQPATVPRDAHHPHPSGGNMLDTGMTRRHLLAAMAAAGLGAALPAPAAGPRGASAAARDGAAAGRRPDSIGVALVGLGYYATHLLAPGLQLTRNCHLAGIVTGSPEKIPPLQQRSGLGDRHVRTYDAS